MTIPVGVEELRSFEATPDDAPAHWAGNSEAAAWADGFASAMDNVHLKGLDLLAGSSPPTGAPE